MKSQINLLKTKRFLPLFITQFFGAFNDNVFKNAFVIWCTYDVSLQLDLDAKLIVTIASALFILPFFIFSFLAGQLADKYEKSFLVKIIKTVEVMLMCFVFVGFYFKYVYFLLFLLFLMGVQTTFFGPMKYSLLPEHLSDDELVSGNAFIEGGTFLAILAGTIFGGIIIQIAHGVSMMSFCVIFFAVIGLISATFIPQSSIGDVSLRISLNMVLQTKKIIFYAKQKEIVWFSVLGIAWFWFLGIIFLSQFPTFTNEFIKGNEYVVTLFFSIFSIGMALGSVMCNKLLKGKINTKLVPVGIIGMSVGIIIFVVASYIYYERFLPSDFVSVVGFFRVGGVFSVIIVLGLFILSIFSGLYTVPLYAIMQDQSEDKYISRVIAANNVVNSFFMVIAVLLVLLLLLLNISLLEIFLLLGIANIFVFFLIKKIA
ncbi:MAG: MFS transporter [Rickettsiales bacterium]|nr:MFS transporter [Rickettsiales bacterium]